MVSYFGDASDFLPKPVINGNYHGIVMIHGRWGLNNDIKKMTEKLASHVFVVLAVDLFDGNVTTTE